MENIKYPLYYLLLG